MCLSFRKRKQNNWVCIGNTHIGKSHITSGLPCQDKISFVCNFNKTACALCDGLGSRENSHFGASLVSNTVVEYLTHHFYSFFNMQKEDYIKELLSAINASVNKYCIENNVEKSSLECTLLFASVFKGKYVIGKIGDGVLGTFKDGKVVDNLYLSKGSEDLEYANSTFTALDSDASKHMIIKTGSSDDIDSLFLISDGLPFLSSKGKTAPKIFNFFKTMNESEHDFANNIIYKEIGKKVEESETCVDDWSFIFIKNLNGVKNSKNQIKSYYSQQINENESGLKL